MKIFVRSLILSVLFCGFARTVVAEGGLSVEPVFQEVSFGSEEGEKSFEITLTNSTEQALVLHPTVSDFGSLDESGGVAFLGASQNLEKKYSLAHLMRPETGRVTLDPGERKAIRVRIENHQSLSPGGHYGAVLFRLGDDAVFDENKVAVQQLISVLVFVKKEGGEVYALDLKDMIWSQNPFVSLKQVNIRFFNAGNVHVAPRGILAITNFRGRTMARTSINPESSLILPESERVYITKLASLAPLFLPGWYTLSLQYRYDGKESFVREEHTIFLFPWQSAALLLCGGCAWFVYRRLKK